MSTSTKQHNKVPELRFLDFAGDWETKKIGSFSDVKSGHTFQSKYQGSKSDEWLYIKVADISDKNNSKYLKTAINTVSKGVMDEINAKPFRAGSIVFPRVGAALLNNNKRLLYKDSLIDDNVLAVSIFDGQVCNDEFFYYWLSTKQISQFCNNGLVPVISASRVKDYEIIAPPLPEQQKIADFLGSVDAWLDNLRQQKTALVAYKRGMMQKLFTQQVRFKNDGDKDFPEWKTKSLGNIAKITTGSSNREGSTDSGKYRLFDRSTDERWSTDFELDAEVLIVAGEGLTFKPRYYNGKFALHQRAYAIINNDSGVNWRYLFYYITFNHHWFRRMSVGTTMPSLRMDAFTKMVISLPNEHEQQKIADFLNTLDESINAKAEEIAKAEQWKKGLMQKMFV